VAGLGDVGFSVESRNGGIVRFVRNNVAVVVRAGGDLAEEAEPLARKLDAAITQQPRLTPDEWQAARPTVTAGSLRLESASAPGQPSLPFHAKAAAGTEIAAVIARVDGKPASYRHQEVLLGSAKGQMEVQITAVADSLLIGTVRRSVRAHEELP
jgi:hypothetical protein